MSLRILTLLFVFGSLLHSCKRPDLEPRWDVDLLLPVARSSVGMEHLVGDSLLSAAPDSSLSIVYERTLFDFNLQNVLNLPDTTITSFYNLPFGSLNLSPGQNIIFQDAETPFNFFGAEIRFVVIRSGFFEVRISNRIKEALNVFYRIPGATLNGAVFDTTLNVAAGTAQGPSVASYRFDMSGYHIGLTGMNGNRVNTLYTHTRVAVSLAGQAVTVVPGDSVTVSSGFDAIRPSYARGYFGNVSFPLLETKKFDLFRKITDGTFSIDSIRLKFRLENFIGADARVTFNSMSTSSSRTGASALLAHAVIGSSMNISRALENPWRSTIQEFEMNNINSNITDLINLMPDQISYSLQVETNPLGNVSGGNDFLWDEKGLVGSLGLEMPLMLSAGRLRFADTTAFDIHKVKGIEKIKDGTFVMKVENHFPIEADFTVLLLDGSNRLVDALFTLDRVMAADTSAGGIVTEPKHSQMFVPVNEQRMQRILNARKAVILADLSTIPRNKRMTIYQHYRMNVKMLADLRYAIN